MFSNDHDDTVKCYETLRYFVKAFCVNVGFRLSFNRGKYILHDSCLTENPGCFYRACTELTACTNTGNITHTRQERCRKGIPTDHPIPQSLRSGP